MSMSALAGSGKQDRVKLAIQSEPTLPPKQPLLLDVAQNLPLTSIIRDVCAQWNVTNPERYAFKYVDVPATSAGSAQKFGYITEDNRSKLRNGDILRIALTPGKAAQDTYNSLKSKSHDVKSKAINDLFHSSKDRTFAIEFFKLEGINCLMEAVEASHLVNDVDIQHLVLILGAFQVLLL